MYIIGTLQVQYLYCGTCTDTCEVTENTFHSHFENVQEFITMLACLAFSTVIKPLTVQVQGAPLRLNLLRLRLLNKYDWI